jgi:GAF domain-containing protein/anti-sigma regulatory factor (Ser/Thr protein kinase)
MTSNLQFNLLNNVGQTLVRRGSISAVLSALAEQFSEAFPHARAILYIRQDIGQPFTRRIAFPLDWYPEWVEQITPQLAMFHREAAKQTQPLILNGAELGNPALFDQQVIICPIHSAGQVEGFLDLYYTNSQPIPSTDKGTLKLLVQQLGIAIGNNGADQLLQIQEGMTQYRTVETLRTAAVAVSSSLELKTVLDQLLAALGNVMSYDAVSIMLLNDGQIDFTTHRGYTTERTVIEQANSALKGSKIISEIIRTKTPVFIDDVRKDSRWIVVPGVEKVCSWIGAPLLSGEDVVGILMVDNAQPNAYGDVEKWLITTLASHAAVAVQNARLHHEVQRQVAELGKLYEATATMMSDLDQTSLFQSVVEEMVTALQIEEGAIFTWDEVEEHLQLAAAFPKPYNGSSSLLNKNGRKLTSLVQLEQYPAVQNAFQRKDISDLQEDSANNEKTALVTAAGLKSAILVPLIWRNEILGCLILGNSRRAHSFSSQEMRMTRTLARQAAIAIEHADLFSQARRRIQELSTIHEIALKLNTPLEINHVLDIINQSALDLIEANNVHIFLYDAAKDQFTIGSALFRDGRRKPAVSSPRSNGITAEVVNGAKQVIIPDARNHRLFQAPDAAAWGIGAIAGFPLKRSDRVLGAFTLTYLNRHYFTDDEILLLSLLADQAAVAIENARLFSDAQRRIRDMSALMDMAQRVTGNLRVEMVMETTVKLLQGLLGARGCSIALLNEVGEELIIEAAAGIDPKWVHKARMKIGEGVSGQAVSERRPIYVRDTQDHPDFLFFDDVLRSLIAVPLISRDEVIGALTVDSDLPKAFEDSDIQLMTIAAAQVSTAIANARLFEEAEDRAAKLTVAYDELKENDRLKDELVQNVSHELRTPLTFVKGYVDLLMDGEMGMINQEQHNTLQIVSDKTLEITRLIDDIMSLQRISSDNLILEQFEMKRLIEEAISGHRLTADQKGLSLEFANKDGSRGSIVADKGRVQQVIDNILVNAIKFSPNGGTIMLIMDDDPEEIMVQIADEGIGLPADKIERIFERFYQVDGTSRRRFGGAGIGLAIVKRIIDAHGGKIWVESEVNKGSNFFFALPKTLEPTNEDEL